MSTAEQQQQKSPTSEEPTQEDINMGIPDSPPYNNNNSSDTPAATPSKWSDPTKINHGAPGSSWNTKKFREEYDRMWETLIDRNWDGAKKYGDPLLLQHKDA